MIPTAGQVAAALTVVDAPTLDTDYPTATTPRVAGKDAATGWNWSWHTGGVQLIDGEYRFSSVSVPLKFSKVTSWALKPMSALLLTHEIGHFTATTLVLRDLCRTLLSLAEDAEVLKCLNDVKKTDPVSLMNEANTRLLADRDAAVAAATSFLSRIHADTPALRSYDTFVTGIPPGSPPGTTPGVLPGPQATWSTMLAFATAQACELSLAMTMLGIAVP